MRLAEISGATGVQSTMVLIAAFMSIVTWTGMGSRTDVCGPAEEGYENYYSSN